MMSSLLVFEPWVALFTADITTSSMWNPTYLKSESMGLVLTEQHQIKSTI